MGTSAGRQCPISSRLRLLVRAGRSEGALGRVRYARVTNVTPRRVVVSGRNYRGWDQMVFANVRGCPLIRR